MLLERRPATGLHVQRPVEDQPGHVAQVRLPGPGLPERLLGQGSAWGAIQRGQRGLLLGGQEGQSLLPDQRLHPDALLQRRAGFRASVGPHRHLRPDSRCPAARWVTRSSSRFLTQSQSKLSLFHWYQQLRNELYLVSSDRLWFCMIWLCLVSRQPHYISAVGDFSSISVRYFALVNVILRCYYCPHKKHTSLPACSYSISDCGSTGRFALSLELFHGRAGRSWTKASRQNLNTAVVVLFSSNAQYNLESSSTGGMTGHQLISVFILFESFKESCSITDRIHFFLCFIFFYFRGCFFLKALSLETILPTAGFKPKVNFGTTH